MNTHTSHPQPELDDTLHKNFASTLPATITHITQPHPLSVVIHGTSTETPWTLAVDCDIHLSTPTGETFHNEYTLLATQLTGLKFVRLEADGAAFDPELVCSDGTRLQLLSEDENNPWYLSCGEVEVEGLPYQDHQLWLEGNLQFEE